MTSSWRDYSLPQRAVRKVLLWRHDPEYIWERDWDLVVVLDACRGDLMAEVADEYEFLDDPGTLISVGSATVDWAEETFNPRFREEMERTAYVTGNPNSVRAAPYEFPDACECGTPLEAPQESRLKTGTTTCGECGGTVEGTRRNLFETLAEVWRTEWDNDIGTIRPRPITQRAVQVARNGSADQMIVHYMQPHQPFIEDPNLDGGHTINPGGEHSQRSKPAWERLHDGDVSLDRLWEAYRRNLEVVLEDVAVLLDNVDADRAVVTADHGNATGELGIYGHPQRFPLESLVDVPWYETTATDRGTLSPSTGDATDAEPAVDRSVDDQLRDLGYR